MAIFDRVKMRRRKYDINVTINDIKIKHVVIDPHYEDKHTESISDELILKLIYTLNDRTFEPVDVTPPFSYFKTDPHECEGKKYRLIWLLEDDQIYIGVVNVHRR
ncbi:MAG: hypothetical protein M9899_02275 [Bdellovibrionaceae bacterium]|nr:hypothetical protein [Pseudobdellovibrionaceae bacterium]